VPASAFHRHASKDLADNPPVYLLKTYSIFLLLFLVFFSTASHQFHQSLPQAIKPQQHHQFLYSPASTSYFHPFEKNHGLAWPLLLFLLPFQESYRALSPSLED
jgi:hypothetical protein